MEHIKMVILRRIACITFMLTLAGILPAQQTNHDITLDLISHEGDMLAVVPWTANGDDLLCVFTKTIPGNAKGETASVKTMAVYLKSGKKLSKISESKTGDWFLTAYPLQEDGRFIVGWGTGSAYHFQIYAYAAGRVKQVFERGSRRTPEVLFDDVGRESLLFTDMEMVGGEWRSSAGRTTVFKWDGKAYETIGTVPWAQRLQCLSKESCAFLK
jgi:hypothetical protein